MLAIYRKTDRAYEVSVSVSVYVCVCEREREWEVFPKR